MLRPSMDRTLHRLLAIGLLTFLLLIPQSLVQELIGEREARKGEAARELQGSWGGDQVVQGPVLTIPFIHQVRHKDEKTNEIRILEQREFAHFLPDRLNVTSQMQPELRYRGIFQFILYQASLRLEGVFSPIHLTAPGYQVKDILWQEAFLTLGVTHPKGLRKGVTALWNQKSIQAEPGSRIGELLSSGITIPLATVQQGGNFSISLELNGTNGISFAPVGRENTVNLSSPWPSPNFNGEFLPVSRQIDDKGFSASWQVLHLNRNYPQEWVGNRYSLHNALFGVNLLQTVDNYQQSTRAVKYAMMFIITTFVAFFLVELLHNRRLHPLQYVLVGMALVLFYTLLVAISEHSTFDIAYGVAALAVTLLIGGYAKAVLASSRLALVLVGLLTGLYLSLYFILQLEKYALLTGTLELFLLLSAVMYLTRKIDWFDGGGMKDPQDKLS
ncbi:MAG: cell envelope integrity protein CreD [Magnetococcales bacterium]|nr:cell envelope integrity protein CreD [Magnetococcales bacterium]NGZ27821.1 cell envelope integrity protein CreD [Magnetococcales bacterium]